MKSIYNRKNAQHLWIQEEESRVASLNYLPLYKNVYLYDIPVDNTRL